MSQGAYPHPIQVPAYRLYLIGRLSAVLAQYAMMLVIGWQAYNIARETMSTAASAAQLGFIGLAQFLPLFLLTPLTGWVADHFDRRMVARWSLALQILC
ncbi:MAG TPA: MFS transporter, partial [Rhizorhapis sp.]|nr:MFS transporter [Rhizorhapis sp.]